MPETPTFDSILEAMRTIEIHTGILPARLEIHPDDFDALKRELEPYLRKGDPKNKGTLLRGVNLVADPDAPRLLGASHCKE